MSGTKKVKSTGRFGAKLGRKIRLRVKEIELEQKRKQKCPFCQKFTVKRLASGIYQCKSCKNKYTSQAYISRVQLINR